jgi:XPG N-terminal domain
MGIKGLKKHLESISHEPARECLASSSYLHVDANGWIFYLMRSPQGLEIARQFGGSYMGLDTLVRDSYHSLLNFGVKPIFYFDGRDTPMKKDTRNERNKKRLESQAAIYDAIIADAEPDQKQLDLPPLTKFQFVHSLKSLGASTIHCNYEADQEIVLACKKANSENQNVHYCYGDDT